MPIHVTPFASNSPIKTSVAQLGAWHHIFGCRQLLAFSQSPRRPKNRQTREHRQAQQRLIDRLLFVCSYNDLFQNASTDWPPEVNMVPGTTFGAIAGQASKTVLLKGLIQTSNSRCLLAIREAKRERPGSRAWHHYWPLCFASLLGLLWIPGEEITPPKKT